MEMRLLKPMMRLDTKLVCFLKTADLVIRWDRNKVPKKRMERRIMAQRRPRRSPTRNISPCLDGQNDEITDHWKQGHQEH